MKDLKKGYPTEAAGPTRRFCQILRLNPDTLADYRRCHSREHIWPEIPEGIRRAGILDMEIYTEGDTAVMILTTPAEFDWDAAFEALAGYERQAEWEAFVAPMQMSGGGRSEEKWRLCERVFSLVGCLKKT